MATTASPQKSPEVLPEDDVQSTVVHDARGALAKNSRLLKEIAALEATLKSPRQRRLSPNH